MTKKKRQCFLWVFTILFLPSISNAQLHPPFFVNQNPPPSSGCGIINNGLSLGTPSPVCYNQSVIIRLTYAIALDTIYIKFGDGRDTIISGANISPNTMDVAHTYNFQPADSCASDAFGPPGISCNVEVFFFKKCNGNQYSYASGTINSMAFRFKPRVRFETNNFNKSYVPGQVTFIRCNSDCIQIDLSNSCTNSYAGKDSSSYWWSYGDGTPNDTFLNTPDNFYSGGGHCYPHATLNPAFYTIKLHAENNCGVSEDFAKIYVEEISNFQLSPGPYCTGSPISLHITGLGGMGNTAYAVTAFPLGNPPLVITGGNTASPSITFNQSGTYTITAGYGSCLRDTIVTLGIIKLF
jgi:hypothetical protein